MADALAIMGGQGKVEEGVRHGGANKEKLWYPINCCMWHLEPYHVSPAPSLLRGSKAL